jgi:hypothetical protein
VLQPTATDTCNVYGLSVPPFGLSVSWFPTVPELLVARSFDESFGHELASRIPVPVVALLEIELKL